MGINILTEELLLCGKAAKRFDKLKRRGRGDEKTAITSVYRWIQSGIVFNRQRVRLEAVKLGTVTFTSQEAIMRFIAATTEAAFPADEPAASIVSPAARRKSSQAADRELQKLGA